MWLMAITSLMCLRRVYFWRFMDLILIDSLYNWIFGSVLVPYALTSVSSSNFENVIQRFLYGITLQFNNGVLVNC